MYMSFTRFSTPAVLLAVILAAVLLIRGIRSRRRGMILCSAGIFCLTGICVFLVMEFIGRM